jgi:enamine deaminase RidA (YjgF/YER057c/UK114 family)
MPEIVRRLNPPTMSSPPGYSHVVEVTGPARMVYVAGQLGLDKSGTFAVGFEAQTAQAFENLKAALEAVGAGFEHLVKITSYIVDIERNIVTFRTVRDRYQIPASLPASTAVGVPALARPGALFEIEAVAVLPAA